MRTSTHTEKQVEMRTEEACECGDNFGTHQEIATIQRKARMLVVVGAEPFSRYSAESRIHCLLCSAGLLILLRGLGKGNKQTNLSPFKIIVSLKPFISSRFLFR